MKKINFEYFAILKGEFEAEGLSRREVATESLYAAKHGLDYLVKIGGCEAKGDMNYLIDLGINSLVAPMIETPFAMQKYMEMLPDNAFAHIGVTIETITAVENINEILEAGDKLTDVTIGRSDLTASYSGEGVDSPKTMEMVKIVAKAAKSRNLEVTVGGSVSKMTRDLFKSDAELRELVDYVETRKAIMPVGKFIQEDALNNALLLEEVLLSKRAITPERVLPIVENRKRAIKARA